ncbi:hypothetical protein BGW38_002701 [Lunasporangiospora selenospora]|uniref:Uncharacterized protein n=1 Tax=Lunasporangiospora selenospora TaxID=979761 RepID=A0A9P6KD69_9FUNG|nr:hypothetical protein BGW38_002701 [Lunasporangiospora selenospora]
MVIDSSHWMQPIRATGGSLQDWSAPFPLGHLDVVQIVELRAFPQENDSQGRSRILIALGHGKNPSTLGQNNGEMELVDAWLKLSVLEVFVDIKGGNSAEQGVESSVKALDSFVPHYDAELFRGRFVKFYSDSSDIGSFDHIAVLGISHDSDSLAAVLTRPLSSNFSREPLKRSYLPVLSSSNQTPLSAYPDTFGASCMTPLPQNSQSDQLVMVMNSKGDGTLWDWKRTLPIARLRAGNTTISPEKDMFTWGIQANFVYEELRSSHLDRKEYLNDIRIVALADGNEKEWGVIYWTLSDNELEKQIKRAKEDRSQDYTKLQHKDQISQFQVPDKILELKPECRHFESSTMGKAVLVRPPPPLCPSSSSSPVIVPSLGPVAKNKKLVRLGPQRSLLFIAFLIWGQFRVTLTTNYGICLVDMDKELDNVPPDETEKGTPVHPKSYPSEQTSWQWETLIDSEENDPIVDIATISGNLFITRKYSHLVWPLRYFSSQRPHQI